MVDIDLLQAYGATYKKIPKGDFIFTEGDSCSFYYQLVTGRVSWLNINDDGEEFIQMLIEPGECFGELPLFDDEPYGESAIADEDIIVIRLHKPIFKQLIAENGAIHFSFSKLLAQRMRFRFMLLHSFACHDPVERIKTLLNYFKKENKNFCSESRQLKLTRQQIADMTGLRVETVIRAMRHMHEAGAVLIENGKVFC
ncbi:MAG: Crp/Fnr family transcriptional regulator [Ferruginibacter sp.]|nr:Crp/Fnr family transcriptional regulator [Ferruginibacter sp.]